MRKTASEVVAILDAHKLTSERLEEIVADEDGDGTLDDSWRAKWELGIRTDSALDLYNALLQAIDYLPEGDASGRPSPRSGRWRAGPLSTR